MGELAERLQIRHHSAVGLVNHLEDQGFVERMLDAEDRRRVFFGLTEKGVRVLENLSSNHRKELQQMAPELRTLLEQITWL